MKKLAFSITFLCLLTGSTMAKETKQNVELMFGAQWYAGSKACRDGNGICISSSSIKANTLIYNDKTGTLYLEVAQNSPAYKQMQDSLVINSDSEIDAAVAVGLGLGKSIKITAGTYKVTTVKSVRRVQLRFVENGAHQ